MDNILLIVLGVIVVVLFIAVIVLIVILSKKNKKEVSNDSLVELGELKEKIANLNNSLEKGVNASIARNMAELNQSLNEGIDKKFSNITDSLNKRVSESFEKNDKTVKDVIERLAKIDEAQKNIQNLSSDVVSLRNVLENNQARGKYGEMQLSVILYNAFGDVSNAYKEQYTIKDSSIEKDRVIADAAVFLPPPNGLIAIDSKFPFQNYKILLEAEKDSQEYKDAVKDFKKACKNHIDAVSSKYIIGGKTTPYALMFIPSDGMFAFIHSNIYSDVIEYGQQKKVFVCSPATLQAMLNTVNVLRIDHERSKNIEDINKQLNLLKKDFEKWGNSWKSYEKYIEKAYKESEKLDSHMVKISKHFGAISNSSGVIENKSAEFLDYQNEEEEDE